MTISPLKNGIASQDYQQYIRSIQNPSQQCGKNSKVEKMIDFFENKAFHEETPILSDDRNHSADHCAKVTKTFEFWQNLENKNC